MALCFWLLLFSFVFSRFVHVAACVRPPGPRRAGQSHRTRLPAALRVDVGRGGCFLLAAVVSGAAGNTRVHVLVRVFLAALAVSSSGEPPARGETLCFTPEELPVSTAPAACLF